MNEKLLLLSIGWLLGVLSPLWVQYIQKAFAKKNIQKALIAELDEFRNRLVHVVLSLSKKQGSWNRELLEWAIRYLNSYEGINKDNSAIEFLENLLELTDDQILKLNNISEENQLKFKSLKKYYISFLDSKVDTISYFSINTQRQLLEIRTNVQIYNDLVDESKVYHFMTFESSKTENNYDNIIQNIDDLFEAAILRAKLLIISIDKLEFLK